MSFLHDAPISNFNDSTITCTNYAPCVINFTYLPMNSQVLLIASAAVSLRLSKVATNSSSTDSLYSSTVSEASGFSSPI